MMKAVAIIPLRKGSKSIIGKNKKKMLGRPLFSWVLGEALFSELENIYVFTDDEDIIEYVNNEYKWSSKVRAIKRSEESATDTASTEMAIEEFLSVINYDFDICCLLQATSPLTTRDDINKVISKITEENYDSALTVVNTKRFIWKHDGTSINYDYLNRPRRQVFDGLLVENGAVYGITKTQYLNIKNRLGGNIGLVEMPEDTLTEIDEPVDWFVLEKLIENRLLKGKKGFGKIKYLVLDVDGVFTDCKVTVSSNGEFSKDFSMRDGMGIEILRENNVETIVITSEDSNIVKKRMEKLKIKHIYSGVKDKYLRLLQLKKELGIDSINIAYVGDDINDLACICSSGWGIAPNDAIAQIKEKADIILSHPGGNNAIREAVDFILKYNNRF